MDQSRSDMPSMTWATSCRRRLPTLACQICTIDLWICGEKLERVLVPKIVQSGIKMGVGIVLFCLVYSQYLRPETILSILFLYLCG